VRLPDLPRTRYHLGGRYGGFGAYNAKTGVLTYAGGAEKRTKKNVVTSYELMAIELDGSMDAWNVVPYPQTVGYSRAWDSGCREMASVSIGEAEWVSVAGTDGCDNGNVEPVRKRGGDIKLLTVGDAADAQSVRWQTRSGVAADALPPVLASGKMKLLQSFAAYDSVRQRVVFGEGTFGATFEQKARSEVYQAVRRGAVWSVTQLRPGGPIPSARFGSCAAYVYQKDEGVDGVLVLGGQEGGTLHGRPLAEVWWLDFSKGANGTWSDVTARFANMKDFGYRRGGACAYDAETKTFYSWMGGADESIPDGSKHSAGMWRVDLTSLGDPAATLSWERLAKDKQTQIEGRALTPSVWDPVNKRAFVIGGRNGLTEYSDVWVIYPGVTGQDCVDLDPYAPFRQPVVPTQAPPPTQDPSQPPAPEACSFLQGRVPAAVITDAIANPGKIPGWLEPANPNLPAGPGNPPRHQLSIVNPGLPWHPLYNSLIYKVGCP
jgi:hypothetical protein